MDSNLVKPDVAERLVEAQEITMAVDSNEGSGAPVLPVERDIGVNDVGIVAWLLTLRSPECPQGRKVTAFINTTMPISTEQSRA